MKSLKFLTSQFLLIAILLSLFSCNDNNSFNPEGNGNLEGIHLLSGAWEEITYEDGVLIMQKTDKLANDKYAFLFSKDNLFIENKNIGWCGTPPISFGEYEGKWSKIGENLFEINTVSWHGETTFQIEVISVGKNILRIKTHY